jgi:hypothetical protein
MDEMDEGNESTAEVDAAEGEDRTMGRIPP